MELRKCECGGNICCECLENEDQIPYAYYAFCDCCGKETEYFAWQIDAIQAWNEGKVE